MSEQGHTPHTKYIRKTKPERRGRGFADMTPEQKARRTARRWTPIHIRFWWDVEKTPTCWLWKGALLASGHGQVSVNGRMRKAHHISLELAGQTALVEGMVVDHVCRVRNCVYPGHLRLVPEAVNALENNLNPWAQNKLRANCKVCDNPLSGENLALVPHTRTKTKHGFPLAEPKTILARQCLTCYPHLWRHAAIPRPRPPGSVYKPTDPDYHLRPSANKAPARRPE